MAPRSLRGVFLCFVTSAAVPESPFSTFRLQTSKRFLFTECEQYGTAAAYNPFLSKKVKKSEIFSELPLANVRENSIIGAVPERHGRNEETEAENEGTSESPRDFRED